MVTLPPLAVLWVVPWKVVVRVLLVVCKQLLLVLPSQLLLVVWMLLLSGCRRAHIILNLAQPWPVSCAVLFAAAVL